MKRDLDLFVVADGMGGHNAGDVASKLATTSLHNFFQATHDGADPGEPTEEELALPDGARRLSAAVRKANRDVFEISSTFQQHHGMGSTVVAAYYTPETRMMHIAHVGDSRAYRIRGGKIEQLTRDHSLVNDALELKPDLKPEEIARLPRNIITRALGMKDLVKIDIRSEPIEVGDAFLLCSDGLSGMISDEEILEVFTISDNLEEACEALIALANEAGGADNITAIIVRFEHDPRVRPTPPPLPPIPKPKPKRPSRSSVPEVVAKPLDPLPRPALTDIVSPEQAAELEAGKEIEISRHTSSIPPKKRSCKRCDATIIPGNMFCVECGTHVGA